MTKPLAFVLQLAGAVFFFIGVIPPREPMAVILGIVLVILGGYGIRKRMKSQKKPL